MLSSGILRCTMIALAAMTFSACYRCGERSNSVASGMLHDDAGTLIATGEASLTDRLGPTSRHLTVAVSGTANSAGAPLKHHVVRGRLVSAGGEVLFEIPTGTETLYLTTVVALNKELSRSEYDRTQHLLLTNTLRIALETDLPGREHIEIPLVGARKQSGNVHRCSFIVEP
jgi:hypothetical protein